jgi:type III secretion system low calcium response chaperone LcrH/SycD
MKSKKQKTNSSLLVFSQKMQQEIEDELNVLIAAEAEGYHNDLVPFSQHKKSVREKGKKFAADFSKQIEHAQNLLKEIFEAEEENNFIEPNAQFARWEECLSKLPYRIVGQQMFEEDEDKSLQEKVGLSWPFMDRAYAVAKKLQEDERYEDAFHIFRFLRILNHLVFDYFVEEANCLIELKKIKEAIDIYGLSLALQPENPYLLYKIGSCLLELNDLVNSKEAINRCIECIQENKEHEKLLQAAKVTKTSIQRKLAA